MPLLRLIAEGVGPFERLDIDLSDGNGNPHLGPHIFAGVNGSGKSTVLRALAWIMDRRAAGFQHNDWEHLLNGHPNSRAAALIRPFGLPVYAEAVTLGTSIRERKELIDWVGSLPKLGLDNRTEGGRVMAHFERGVREKRFRAAHGKPPNSSWNWFPPTNVIDAVPHLFNVAAYSPSRALRYLASPDMTKTLANADQDSLAFESTVQNESIQAWLLSLYSRRAIARERHQSGEEYTRSLGRFEKALQLIYGESVSFEVEIEPTFQPRLKVMGRSLNFSQLPDGVRSTVAWIADFMMRQDLMRWDPKLGGKRPGVLLLDEVDAHLHPLWQRKLLPAMREALPDVQILVTSHSPFVISSCPNSRVHVLELDQDGRAHARPPVDSPIGESVTTTLKEIFGVDSRFDVLTEKQLDEWNVLKRREAGGPLLPKDKARLQELTVTLSERSEELRSIVASPLTIPASVLRSLTAAETKPQQIKRKKRA
jgi:energy-coupling factor transporter ATP-binding protein EcfA2